VYQQIYQKSEGASVLYISTLRLNPSVKASDGMANLNTNPTLMLVEVMHVRAVTLNHDLLQHFVYSFSLCTSVLE
jgi:hypothetical protein